MPMLGTFGAGSVGSYGRRGGAAAAIAAFEGEQDLDVRERISRGLKKAEKAVDSGATTALLQKWIALTQSLVVPS